MESSIRQDINTQPNPGVQVELLLEFQELEDLVPQEVDREPLVTCVEREECLPHSKPIEDGTERPISTKRDMP